MTNYFCHYFIFSLHKPNPNRMKPIAISDVYTQGSAIAKFKPKVGSIILETARSTPPAISNDVVVLVFA